MISNFEYVIESLTFINEALTSATQEEITQRFIDNLFASFSESMLRIAINRFADFFHCFGNCLFD